MDRRERLMGAVLLLATLTLVAAGLDTSYMMNQLPLLLGTVPLVLAIAFVATVLACAIGLAVALASLSHRPALYVSARFFVSTFQGVPLVVVLFLLYFGLPQLSPGLVLTSIQAGIIGLALSNGAFLTEVFRASIQAVAKGQTEAALASGMTDAQAMRRVVLPQAARLALPPTSNYYIFILKDSALVGFIGVSELFLTARSTGQRDFQVLEMLVLAALIYWSITLLLSVAQRRLEKRVEAAYTRQG